MKLVILAIETSCDETRAAIIKNGKEVLNVLIVCEKYLFSSEIDDLEKVVYQHDEASLAKIKKRVLKKL